MNARVIAIANQKGGVGKTTTAVNLSAALSQLGRRVLLIDLDPQGNATTASGLTKHALTSSVYPLLLGLAEINSVTQRAGHSPYDVWPANRELAGAEVELIEVSNRNGRLKEAVEKVINQYDDILIDCPPALNLLTINGLSAANWLIIPMQCEYFALEGLTDLVNTVKAIRKQINPDLEIRGLLRTMFDPRNMLTQQVSSQLQTHFGDKVYRTVIPRNVRLAESPSFGLSVFEHDATSKGAKAYLALAKEILVGTSQ